MTPRADNLAVELEEASGNILSVSVEVTVLPSQLHSIHNSIHTACQLSSSAPHIHG